MTEIKINVTVNGEVDVQKIAEQIRQQIEAVKKPAFKIGDYVKTLMKSKYGGIKEGEIVKVEQTNFHSFSGHKIAVRKDENSIDGIFRPSELIHATDEEVAEAKAAAKWASINRKPKEFKTGDIVRVNGHFAEVTRVGIYDLSVLNPTGSITPVIFERIELITPIEQRFDLAHGDR